MSDQVSTSKASTRRLARTRGAGSGILLVALGAWGALVPFIGPWFDFAYSPDNSWHWTAARGWLEVLPGAVTLAGGLLLLASASRITTSLGAWLGIAGGAWFIVGPQLATALHLGSPGVPTGSSSGLRALESLAYFYGLGAVILFLAAAAFGRLSVVTVRDVRVAERRTAVERDAAERTAATRQIAEGDPERSDWAQRREVAARAAAQQHTSGPAGSPEHVTRDQSMPQDQYAQPQYAQPQYAQPQYSRGHNPSSAPDAPYAGEDSAVGSRQAAGYQPPPGPDHGR